MPPRRVRAERVQRVRTRAAMLAALALAALAVCVFVAVPRTVTGSAMLPALWPGDELIVARYARAKLPARGDVVVARVAGGERIGRVVGLPGERIGMARGRPVVNGARLPRYRVADLVLPLSPLLRCPVAITARGRIRECRVERYRETAPEGAAWDVLAVGATARDDRPAVTVPAGRLLLLPDNRGAAAATPALVATDAVIGRATTILWSHDRRGAWRHPWRWGATLRRGRIMKGVERGPA